MLVAILDTITKIFAFLDSQPSAVKVVVFLVAAALSVYLFFRMVEHDEIIFSCTFGVYFQIMLFTMVGINLAVINGDARDLFCVNVKSYRVKFLPDDPSTWETGFKVFLAAMVIVLILAVLQPLFKRDWRRRFLRRGKFPFERKFPLREKLKALLFVISLSVAVYYIAYDIFTGNVKSTLIAIPLNLVMNIATPLLLLGGWILAIFYGITKGGLGNNAASSDFNASAVSEAHGENYGAVMRMPNIIKDESCNIYRKIDIDIGGTYVTYTGPGGPVTIYGEDIGMFSATGDGHHFHWSA